MTGCSSSEGTGDKGYVSADGSWVEVPIDERGQPVSLTGPGLDGAAVSLDDLRGRPAVVAVWGSWCPPCRKEAPDLAAVATDYAGRVGFLGINIRDASTEQAEAFVRSFDLPYPSVYSPDGRALLAFSGTLTPNSIPALVVLDARGRVASSIIGPLPSRTTLTSLIDSALEEGSGG